jgi:catechol 2,3-dioxygenase
MTSSWPLKRAGLRVRNLDTTLAYYQSLGLSIVHDQRAEGIVGLGIGTNEILTLRHVPDALPRPAHTAGLYHIAYLLPDDKSLATFLRYSLGGGVRLDGASDHLASQALYLNDPEENGVEVYSDRPRDQWKMVDGRPELATLPLKAQQLLEQAEPTFSGFPDGTVLGHIHLSVVNLDESLAWYLQTFSLDLIINLFSQAGFISWDGYHHHIGMNTWEGSKNSQKPEYAGLDFFEISHADVTPGTYEDPNGIRIVVTA